MAALSNPAPAAALATSDDGNFQISLYQCVLHGRSKAGVPPVLLGQSALGAAATTADFVKLVLNIARRASAAASAAAAGAEAAGAAAFDIPVEKIGATVNDECTFLEDGYQLEVATSRAATIIGSFGDYVSFFQFFFL